MTEEAEIAFVIERAVERRVEEAVQAERDRIAARLRRMVDYHAEYPLEARTSRELLLGMAKAIEEGTE